MGTDLVKVICGLRRSGKSVMLQLIKAELLGQGVAPAQILEFNFEDMQYRALHDHLKLEARIRAYAGAHRGKLYLFLDEIQEVESWELTVNSLRSALNCEIYLTDSNSRLLSGELATYLAGRYVQFTLYPFSYREFLLSRQLADSAHSFQDYLTFGGMPFLSTLPLERQPILAYLSDLTYSVLFKDILQRNGFRHVDLLQRVINYAFANTGQIFSATSLSRFLKSEQRRVATDTLLDYLRACTTAYILTKIPRFDLKDKRPLSVNEKYYATDLGMREAVAGHNIEDLGQCLENVICVELLRRGYTVYTGSGSDFEIDFVALKDHDPLYIQVCYQLSTEDTIKREFGAFRKLRDNFPRLVLSLDEFDFSRDGIHHLNIRDFLLSDGWEQRL
ncbi:MAG: ATP-binding protein [Succinivibrio sp.]|nr:ATP-binding protein [Succinivibrio sp.]